VVTGPRGNRGEVVAVPLGSRKERYALLREVFLCNPYESLEHGRLRSVQSVWLDRGRVVFKFQGVDSIAEAEKLRGLEVRIPRTSRLELAPGEYYLSDLIGCDVTEASGGLTIGKVCSWEDYGGSVLLVVEDRSGNELMIPFAQSICVNIDVEARRIQVNLPEGLKELNRP